MLLGSLLVTVLSCRSSSGGCCLSCMGKSMFWKIDNKNMLPYSSSAKLGDFSKYDIPILVIIIASPSGLNWSWFNQILPCLEFFSFSKKVFIQHERCTQKWNAYQILALNLLETVQLLSSIRLFSFIAKISKFNAHYNTISYTGKQTDFIIMSLACKMRPPSKCLRST